MRCFRHFVVENSTTKCLTLGKYLVLYLHKNCSVVYCILCHIFLVYKSSKTFFSAGGREIELFMVSKWFGVRSEWMAVYLDMAS